MIAILTVLFVVALMFLITALVPKLPISFGSRDGFARIKLGPNIVDIRGRIKNVIYSIWKNGVHYCRTAAAIISNPESAKQAQVRELMTLASKRWYDDLTEQQRANWSEYAAGLEPQEGDAGGILNIIPQNRGVMSGFNAYCMAYVLVRKCAITLPGAFDDAPLGQTPPDAPTGLSIGYIDPNVTIEWVDPVTVTEDSKVRIWLRSHENIAHRQHKGSAALAVQLDAINSFRGAQGADIQFNQAPGHYLFQMDTVQPNGLKSNPSNTIEVTVA